MNKNYCKILSTFLLLACVMATNVFAEENDIYFENSNGVQLTKQEYDFLGEFYYDGYQEYITRSNYLRLKSNEIFDKNITKLVIDEGEIQPLSYDEVSYQSASKKLAMSYACSSKCVMSLVANWLTIANVRSYDLIGAYSPTSNALKYDTASMNYSGNSDSPVATNKTTNGIAATFKLPTTDAKFYFVMDFTAPIGTKVYGSYQHAKKAISLSNSGKYTFASSGYGGVFRFDTSVSSYYDAMGGVVLTTK